MKTTLIAALAFALIGSALAQEEKKNAAADASNAEQAKAPSQAELEAKFTKLLTNAFLTGRWSPVENGKLGEEKKGDTYEIVKAAKIKDDQWVVHAKLRYGQNEFVMPIPVQVQWAGGTPILIVNHLNMGRERSYSARVLFFADSYSGSWDSSAGYGGVLYGTIEHDVTPPAKPEGSKKSGKE